MLNKKEITPILNKVGKIISCNELDEVLTHMDVDGSGKIDYSEFTAAVLAKEKLLTEKNLQQAFNTFDVDKTGKISKDDLKSVLGIGTIVNKHLDTVIKQADKNKDGEISYEEFKTMMLGNAKV
jgi:calcium-dependent protein kinase